MSSVQFRAAEKQKERDLERVRFYKQSTPTGFEDSVRRAKRASHHKQIPAQISQDNLPLCQPTLAFSVGGQTSPALGNKQNHKPAPAQRAGAKRKNK
jgi:hypothetical protein